MQRPLNHYFSPRINPKRINGQKSIFVVEVLLLTISSEKIMDWVYRIFDRRTISVKAKNDQVRKMAAVDLLTGLPFAVDVPMGLSLEDIKIDKTYFASLKVYTAQETGDVQADFVEFFKVLDVDQSMDDFIKAYWLFPKLIKFELVEVEPT
jgi:hypothetical protein